MRLKKRIARKAVSEEGIVVALRSSIVGPKYQAASREYILAVVAKEQGKGREESWGNH